MRQLSKDERKLLLRLHFGARPQFAIGTIALGPKKWTLDGEIVEEAANGLQAKGYAFVGFVQWGLTLLPTRRAAADV